MNIGNPFDGLDLILCGLAVAGLLVARYAAERADAARPFDWELDA